MNAPALPLRDGSITIARLIDDYMAVYEGRDPGRVHRLAWWAAKVGALRLDEVTDDHVAAALQELEHQPCRYYAGRDADGKRIYRAKPHKKAPATLNRYHSTIGAVFSWAIKRRIAPKGWAHPCRGVERRPENNERVRFLSEDERRRLLDACRASKWPRLYALVLAALTTGARKGELIGLRWADVDFEHAKATVGRTKNGSPKVLVLMPAVLEELRRFKAGASSLVFASTRDPERPFAFEPRFHVALKVARIRDFTFHSLRHSFASTLAANGATLLEIADLLGHRQLQMTKRYSHLTTGHKAALVARVMGDLR